MAVFGSNNFGCWSTRNDRVTAVGLEDENIVYYLNPKENIFDIIKNEI